jgi:hypothetical protein
MSTEEQQKKNEIDNFKRQSRNEALRIASNNRPTSLPQGLGSIGHGQQLQYDLLAEAEKIYQWLIKDL